MVIAIRRVDLARENLNKPIPAAAPGGPPQQFGPTAARDLLDALSDLRSVQNNVMSVWLAYYAVHMQLIRDLGVMRIDEQGRWVPEPLDAAERAQPSECPLPPAVPSGWMQQLENCPDDAASLKLSPAVPPAPPMSPDLEIAPQPPENANDAKFPSARHSPRPDILQTQAISRAKPLPLQRRPGAEERPTYPLKRR